jgi:hypothetical protein|tara:strand:+ start:468 stop:968 length:501 start_codon:yes stop_codon:yes gene_type:complete
MYCVQILKNDEMKEVKVKQSNILKSLTKLATTNGSICELYSWDLENIKTICYGSYDGESGFENKHELPPNGISNFLEEDSSEKMLFGDLFIVRFQNDKLINTAISDYGEFYNLVFNGFDDCIGEEDEYSSETEEECVDNNSDIEEEFEIISGISDIDNLDNDTNNY